MRDELTQADCGEFAWLMFLIITSALAFMVVFGAVGRLTECLTKWIHSRLQ